MSIGLLSKYRMKFLSIQGKVNVIEDDYYDNFKELLAIYFKEDDGYHIQINKTDIWSHNIDRSYIDKPDFLILKRKIPILRIEGKLPNNDIEGNLKHDSNDRLFNQIYRYRGREGVSLPVGITDFKKLWIIENASENSLRSDHQVHSVITILNDDLSVNPDSIDELRENFEYLTRDLIISINRLQNLIEPLAEHTRSLHDEIIKIIMNTRELIESELEIHNNLIEFRNDLKRSIFKDSKIDDNEQFADFFAQAIIYSSFLGWLRFCKKGNPPSDFKISTLHEYLPKGTFIQKTFVNLKKLITQDIYEGLVKGVEDLLSGTEFTLITRNIDILMATFYSDFLNLYDAEKAKSLGVVFTPIEIVDYIVDGIDKILQCKLEKPDGILSNNINFLDPASGTMSFACSIARKGLEKIEVTGITDEDELLSAFENWVKASYLNNMFAFEILMAPYILGHLKTMITIEDLGAKIDWSQNQLNSFLMNTLMEPPQTTMDHFLKNEDIREEIMRALYTRESENIMVVLGNPPYNISSQNDSTWIRKKIKLYKEGLTERNLKILSDDYVKFLRFAHWRIAEKNKMGIVGFITNNKYFYGDIFREMRAQLKRDFDLIYTVNLHGDLRKQESGNPFDIRVGVGIVFLVRLPKHSNENCEIFFWDVPEDTKNLKFSQLNEGFQFNKFEIVNNDRYFINIDAGLDVEEEFNSFMPITEFFISPPKSGIMSGRDALVYNITKSELVENYELFYKRNFKALEEKNIKVNDTKTWKIEDAIENFREEEPEIIKVNYRGFDVRYLLYDTNIVDGHRRGYITQISEDCPAISTTKNVRGELYTNCLITKYAVEKCFLSVKDTSYAFLLNYNGVSNIRIPKQFNFSPEPSDIFYYIYAVINSNVYREKYASQLLRNYPRIPVFLNENEFSLISELGYTLAQNHLSNGDFIDISGLERSSDSNYRVYKEFHYNRREKTIKFGNNPDAFWIKPIEKEVWAYEIGGRRQLSEWLKARIFSAQIKKNTIQRSLKEEEIQDFFKICVAIKNGLEIIKEIDVILGEILDL